MNEPSALQLEALTYVRSYKGHFNFLKSMTASALRDPDWVPSPKQAVSILKSRTYEGNTTSGRGSGFSTTMRVKSRGRRR